MMYRRRKFGRAIAAALLVLGSTGIVIAQNLADFFKNRSVDLYIGYSPGGLTTSMRG